MRNRVREHIGFHLYFDSFGIEYMPQEVLSTSKDKSITQHIFEIQDDESIMCGFYCLNDKIIFKYSKD